MKTKKLVCINHGSSLEYHPLDIKTSFRKDVFSLKSIFGRLKPVFMTIKFDESPSRIDFT